MAEFSLLIVDDERAAREGLAELLGTEYAVETARSGAEAVNLLRARAFDAVLTDLRMPDGDGMKVLAESRQHHVPCVVLTAYGSVQIAVEAMREGAYDFIIKPYKIEAIEALLARLFAHRASQKKTAETVKPAPAVPAASGGGAPIIGNAPSMKALLDKVELVAPTQATVLITGESGTGKELIARALHEQGGFSGEFVPVHCAALPENLLEAELFGHEKGAFTGAAEMRKGRFEFAANGTVFLDEIGEIAPAVQVKLLRVLENRVFERVGGNTPIPMSARIVSATNCDLAAMVRRGTFREDLYFRLNVIELHLPPLRERAADIPLLLNYYLEKCLRENRKPPMSFAPETLTALSAYPWPGNIRELRNCVERMVVLSRDSVLTPDRIPENLRAFRPAESEGLARDPIEQAVSERDRIARMLEQCHQNRTEAAEKLGISRRTLHRKINAYHLEKKSDA